MMQQWIISRRHYDGLVQITRVGSADTWNRTIELIQRRIRQSGRPDGITWRAHSGDIASALIASHNERSTA
jgi:hypothetical protein